MYKIFKLNRQLLAVDKNLYNTEKHLQNILDGKQNDNLEYLDRRNVEDHLDFESLKRREFVKESKKNRNNNFSNTNNGVSLFGSGNVFNSKNIETIIAREKYLQEGVNNSRVSQNFNRNNNCHNNNNNGSVNNSGVNQINRRKSSQYDNQFEERNSNFNNPKEHNDNLFKPKRQSYNQSISSPNELNETYNRRSNSNQNYNYTNRYYFY